MVPLGDVAKQTVKKNYTIRRILGGFMKKFLIALCSIILLTAANKNCDDIDVIKIILKNIKKS